MSEVALETISLSKKRSFWYYFSRNKALYVMLLPGLINLALFKYLPMWGIIISFQQFHPAMGIAGSRWVGFKHFIDFFTDPYFYRIIRNTLVLGVLVIFFSFPAPIVFALLLNEIIVCPLFAPGVPVGRIHFGRGAASRAQQLQTRVEGHLRRSCAD